MHRTHLDTSRLILLLLACFVFALAAACQSDNSAPAVSTPTHTPAETPTVGPTVAVAPTATPAPTAEPAKRPDASAFPPDLANRAQSIFDAVAAQRGTPAKATAEMFLLSRDQARAYYSPNTGTTGEGTNGTPAPRRLDAKNELYKLLGLIPDRPETDVERQSVDNLITQITGFYSADLDAFYMLADIIGGVNGASATATMAHEFTHALQDQYHDLNAIASERAGDWDSFRVLQDIMEGDAIAAENAYLGFALRSTYRAPVCFLIPAPARPNLPFVVERELDTWYEDGLCFVNAVVPQLPKGIADIWDNLPTTTEQILHPDKYFAGEDAMPVDLPSLTATLGEGWQRLERSTFGEFSLQNLLLLGMTNDRPGVQRAAAGWGGDAWALHTHDDARLFSYVVKWDSADEAAEFWSGFVRSLTNREPSELARPSEAALNATIGASTWRAVLDGDQVTLVVSNDVGAIDRVAPMLGLP